ncbi:MAG TPA: DMT family transporter [Streptosporangiaceae bacterium]|nr:DMT family transporter [Streptosporangiaceae bacterium]
MLAIILALAAAAGYGGSDFAAGLASRRASVIRVTLLSEAVSVAVVGLALAAAGAHPPDPRAVAWGAVAGLAGVSGALALYAGFRHAAFSVAGPLSAVGAAGFSVLAGLLLGERPTALALTGIVLALPAIVGVSASVRAPSAAGAAARGRAALGVSYGLVAGACFALLFIGLSQAGSGSGLWPVFCGQVTALAAVGCVGAVTGDLRLPEARGWWLAALTGLTGAPATVLYFLATHHGLLAITAVITSLYPAVTIMLARVLLGERLTAVRLTGLLLAAASVALIAAGSHSQ